MITITKDHLPTNLRRRPGNKIKLQYLCVHSTGNPRSTAKNERAWLTNPSNKVDASWNYCIDQYDCIEAIPAGEAAWAQQGGNSSCASLEICESGNREITVDRAAEFCADFLKARGWDTSRLKRHNDYYAPKKCPRIFYENGSWNKWEDFKALVKKKMGSASASTNIGSPEPIFKGIALDDLNIRPDASTSRPPVGSLSKGQTVNIYFEKDGFYKINGGYVSATFIQKVSEIKNDDKSNLISIKIDGKLEKVDGFIEDGRTFIQLKDFAEKTKYFTTGFDKVPLIITANPVKINSIKVAGDTISVSINGQTMKISGKIKEGRTYLQIKDFSLMTGLYELSFVDGAICVNRKEA